MLDPEDKGYSVEVREVVGCSKRVSEDRSYNDCLFLERRFQFVGPSTVHLRRQAPRCSTNKPGSVTAPSPLMQD